MKLGSLWETVLCILDIYRGFKKKECGFPMLNNRKPILWENLLYYIYLACCVFLISRKPNVEHSANTLGERQQLQSDRVGEDLVQTSQLNQLVAVFQRTPHVFFATFIGIWFGLKVAYMP